MQEAGDGVMEELHNLVTKLNNEADKLHNHVDKIQKQGEHLVHKAESVISTNMRQRVKNDAKRTLIQLIEQLVEMNCNIELADIDSSSLSIPYMPVGQCPVSLKFLTGDSPWNFWLLDEAVGVKTVNKVLLKKYQNGLLEPFPHPKSSESVCFVDRNKVFRGIVLQAINENRVKVLDCDSNISKVILNDKLFKADPDACSVHASVINCTIGKEPDGVNLWTSDLRDVFCDALKEAVLGVKIIERLPGNLPSFVVSVMMKNEEENCKGSLEEWILHRLLPELRKISKIENEAVCDFLSSESLNPYYKCYKEVIESREEVNHEKIKLDSTECSSEEDNNLNSTRSKVATKVVPNINHEEEESVVSSSAEESSVSSNSCELQPKLSQDEPVLDKEINQETDLKIIGTDQTVAERLNQKALPRALVPQQPPINVHFHSGFPVQYTVPPQYRPIPRVPPWGYVYRPPLPPQHYPPWRPGHDRPRGPPPEAMNGTAVNVMAPEFVPKVNIDIPQNLYPPQVMMKKHSATTELSEKEIVHVLLRKPSSLLMPGENLVVMISHVVSPGEFYVHFITKNNKYLDKLMDDMFDHYNSNAKASYTSWQEARKALGEFCACKWMEDNHWYRVQVDNWCPIENHVKVTFVDFGNVDIVPLDCIQPLAQQFAKLSMCAQLCHLAKVLPSVKKSPWSEEAIQFFKTKVEVSNSKAYSVTVVPPGDKVAKNNSLAVLLFEGKASDCHKSINEQMVDCGLAWSKHFHKQITYSDSDICSSLENDMSDVGNAKLASLQLDPIPQPNNMLLLEDEKDKWEDWDPLVEEYNSARNNPARDTDDPGVALIGYSAKDEQRICQFFARDGFCRKQLCTKEHITPHPDGVTTDKEEVYCRAFSEMVLPAVGETIDVRVTSVSSISLFYVQLPARDVSEFDDDEEETLILLTEYLNKPENIAQMKYLKVPPAVGQLVLAKWDGDWYRARVVSCDEESLEVMFVDFGSIGYVPETDLREMEPCYLHLPFQAVECSLANVIPPDNSSPDYEEASDRLRKLIEGKLFEAVVYDRGETGEVQRLQVALLLDNGIDACEYLVSNNLCSLRL